MVQPRVDMTGWKMWEHGAPDSRLTIIKQIDDYIGPDAKHFAQWLCECGCEEHNKIAVTVGNIRRTKSCGCLARELSSEHNLIDMTGWIMSEHGVPDSKLTVLERVENTPGGKPQWLCECNCNEHNKVIVSSVHLKDGSVKSCGCLYKKVHFDLFHKINDYEINGEVVIGKYNNCDKTFLFDTKFYDQFSKFCWYENYSGYTEAWDYENNCSIKMHQIVAGKYCDHINRKKWDNRTINLRPATQQQNRQNSSLRKDNSTGVTGVNKDKYNNYIARIQTKTGERYVVYYGISKTDAIKARLSAEAKYYKEFAPQKHLFEQYGINTTE